MEINFANRRYSNKTKTKCRLDHSANPEVSLVNTADIFSIIAVVLVVPDPVITVVVVVIFVVLVVIFVVLVVVLVSLEKAGFLKVIVVVTVVVTVIVGVAVTVAVAVAIAVAVTVVVDHLWP